MKQYLDLLQQILDEGEESSDRTGVGTKKIFGHMMRFDLQKGFPLLTTKKLHLKSIIHELLWFLRGETNNKSLNEKGVRIWNDWADENGELGPIYGFQWRSWPNWVAVQPKQSLFGRILSTLVRFLTLGYCGPKMENHPIDQIANAIQRIKDKPQDRRHIVSAWNVAQIDLMALPPCHILFQFNVIHGKLSCLMYQRSCDTFLGVPYNVASYALLTMMMAQVTGYQPGEFIWVGGDTHLYLNHLEQARLQLTREPRDLPTIVINPEVKSIFDFKYEDFKIEGYDNPHPHIPAAVAV